MSQRRLDFVDVYTDNRVVVIAGLLGLVKMDVFSVGFGISLFY